MKRILSLLLTAVFMLAAFAACGSDNGAGNDMPAQDADVPAETTEADEVFVLPDADYGGTDFTVLTAAEQWIQFYESEQTGDIVNDAVYSRNLAVEEKYNVKLNYSVFNGNMGGMDSVHTALAGTVMSGSGDYDMIAGGAYYITGYTAEGLYADLSHFSQIVINSPWYDSYVNQQFEICGRQYLMSGALGVAGQSDSIVTFFNKNLGADYNIENLYDSVKAGRWTYDKLAEICTVVVTDLNGDGVISKDDRVGLLSTWDYMSLESGAMGYFYTDKTGDGGRKLKDINEKLLAVNDIIYGLYQSDIYLEAEKLGGANMYDYLDNMRKYFASDGSMFMIHRLCFATYDTMREMENFGILPSPKFDEAQDSYITPVPSEASGIPFFVNDEEMSATIFNALHYYSAEIVRPAYFETAIKRKSTRDDESVEMLEIISGTMACDFMFLYSTLIDGVMYNIGDADYASKWAEDYDRIQIQIDNLVETVKALD